MENTWVGHRHFKSQPETDMGKIGRVDFIVAIATDHIGELVIGHDEDNVRIFGHLIPPFITTIVDITDASLLLVILQCIDNFCIK